MFHDLHKEYWALPWPNNISASEQASVEGGMLAKFLEKYSTFLSKHKPMYEFLVPKGNVVISLCLPTTVRIFGLPKKTFQVVQHEHTKDKKMIGLSLLKFFPKFLLPLLIQRICISDFAAGFLNK